MSKKSRKMKWKGVALNHSNIDEYMKDLIEDTAGQYITQGVSFNKEDNFQMTLLKNSILAHGSFSGFVKNLLFAYFEKNGSIDDSVWQPNAIIEAERNGNQHPSPPPSSPIVSSKNEPIIDEVEEQQQEQQQEPQQEPQQEQQKQEEDNKENPEPIAQTSETPVQTIPKITQQKPNKQKRRNANATAFLPQK